MYKIIFFDLDGTLLTTNKQILKENIDAIGKVNNLGVETVLCSGRQKNAVSHYKKEAGSGKYVICNNGAEIFDYENEKVIYTCDMDKEEVLKLYQFAIKNNLVIKIDTTSNRYVSDENYALVQEVKMEDDVANLVNSNSILQINIWSSSEEKINETISFLNSFENFKVENKFYFEQKEMWIINCVDKNVSKGNAVLKLCDYLSIDVKEAMCFGDDKNDISMFNVVGYSVAMKNGSYDIKNIAKEITTTNDESGIAKILKSNFFDCMK